MPTIIINKRLAPALTTKQNPFKGHPVFVAQHATTCCCRGCLEKWHQIPFCPIMKYLISVLFLNIGCVRNSILIEESLSASKN